MTDAGNDPVLMLLLAEVAAGAFDVDVGKLTTETSFKSLPGWDSLAQLEFVVGLEEALNLRLGAEDVETMDSLRDAFELVAKSTTDE